jgi:hypothetical protein
MTYLHFTDKRRIEYAVNDKGYIVRVTPRHIGNQNYTDRVSGQWLFRGLAYTGPGWKWGKTAVYFEDITPKKLEELKPILYRTSRNPRYTVMDTDHGTNRIWGNGNGVTSIWFEEEV